MCLCNQTVTEMGVQEYNNISLADVSLGHVIVEYIAKTAMNTEIHDWHTQCFLQNGRINSKGDIGIADQNQLWPGNAF